MAETRKGDVTFKGKPIELVGPKLKAGDKAPDFTCVGAGLALVGLKETAGKTRLFNVVPSLDTPVCNTQTRRFAEEMQALGDKAAAYTVSLDLPFAQKRWCTEAKVENVKNLSDVRDHSFGEHYGVLIKGLPIPLLARAVFVVDPQDTIKYVEIVPEITTEPDYAPARAALKEAARGVSRFVGVGPAGNLGADPNPTTRNDPLSYVDGNAVMSQCLAAIRRDPIIVLDPHPANPWEIQSGLKRDHVAGHDHIGALGDEVRRLGMAEAQAVARVGGEIGVEPEPFAR